ncbi:MAG: hypothetical protein SVG88_00210 [Halobacteriales archaeon]|nr:hypothetical protein [Halobacteriales archaeon]
MLGSPSFSISRIVGRAVRSASRYDLVLALIPSAFVIAMLLGNLVSLSMQSQLLVASIVGAIAVIDALFLNPPNPKSDE